MGKCCGEGGKRWNAVNAEGEGIELRGTRGGWRDAERGSW